MIAPLDPVADRYPEGPTRAVWLGPPGTGKTMSAINVVIKPALLAGVSPSMIRALSFSRAAATTLASRLADLDTQAAEIIPGTLHSLALGMVRQLHAPDMAPLIGATDLSWRPEQADRSPDDSLPEGRLPDRSEPTTEEERVANLWDLARNLMIIEPSSDAFARLVRARAPDLPLRRVMTLIVAYEARKASVGAVDFTDLLILALSLPAAPLRQLVLDEAQDSTSLQWALLDRLIAASEHAVLVGDPDQTIYGWAGASPDELHSRIRSGAWAVRRLARSHRVPPPVHALANGLIRRNRDRVDAAYEPASHDGRVKVASQSEALKAIEEASLARREVLVLARRARDLDRWGRELDLRAVPYLHERGACPLGSPHDLRLARAVLRLREGLALRRLDASEVVKTLNGTVLTAGREVVVAKTTGSTAEPDRIHPAEVWVTPEDLVRVGVQVQLLRDATVRAALRLVGIRRERADGLARLVERHGRHVLSPGAAHLASSAEVPPPNVRVKLTTMHASKGREADLVALDLTAPRLVRLEVARDREAEAAERRLLYVGLTRSKKDLLLVRPPRHDLGQLLGLRPITVRREP